MDLRLLKTPYPLFDQLDPCIYEVGCKQITLEVDPQRVLPPSEASFAIAEAILGMQATSVLDIGSGSGLLTIVMSHSGCDQILAIDINSEAIQCTEKNVFINNVSAKVHYETRDILTMSGQKFNLIVGNAPFMPIPRGLSILSKEIDWAINGGPDGTSQLITFGQKAADLLTTNGRFIFALPHFVDYKKVTRELSHRFKLSVIAQKTQRYWPPEYDERCEEHIQRLAEEGVCQFSYDGNHYSSRLDVVQGILIN